MGTKRNVDMSANEDVIKVVSGGVNTETQTEGENTAENVVAADQAGTEAETQAKAAKKKREARGRSRKYVSVRAQVDKTKMYDPFAAVELIKKLSYSKFTGTITADAVVRDEGASVTLTFPHSTGKTVRAAIVSDELLKQIEAGVLDFDILITEPRYMPQLAKFARVLGPKGLMPNPKNGTVTANPELKKKELEGGKITVKGEKKAPLMHVIIGKTDMDTKALVENLNTLLTVLKGQVVKLSISASMSPSVKVMVA